MNKIFFGIFLFFSLNEGIAQEQASIKSLSVFSRDILGIDSAYKSRTVSERLAHRPVAGLLVTVYLTERGLKENDRLTIKIGSEENDAGAIQEQFIVKSRTIRESEVYFLVSTDDKHRATIIDGAISVNLIIKRGSISNARFATLVVTDSENRELTRTHSKLN